MNSEFEKNWTNYNNGYTSSGSEVERYVSVVPNVNQLKLAEKPFYAFMHFGMNTATAREWGKGTESVDDFTIKSINTKQWVSTVKACGATGIILTCKHHDGFCLWESKYTDFSVKNSDFDGDIVKLLSDECHRQGLDFGVYLSPWDMYDKRYGKPEYNDYFCNQLTELLTNYGEIFEVWFDGAKGENAVDFDYDWERYFKLIRELQPSANIAICGPDIRWVGNEGGKTRKNEYSVVPVSLRESEGIQKNSQHDAADAAALKKISSADEDLGSRAILEKSQELCWYPAEVDVSIRRGWFHCKKDNRTLKSPKKLFNIYLNSVGNNCTLLLNIPPSSDGVVPKKDTSNLVKLGEMIKDITASPIAVKKNIDMSKKGFCEINFGGLKKVRYIVISEDIKFSQRVEAFDVYLKGKNGSYKKACSSTIIGSKKIIKLRCKKCIGAALVIRQSRSVPHIKELGFYE